MPPNTIKVDRSTPWGNPFIVGTQGNAAECVYWFILLLGGYLNVSHGANCAERQEAFRRRLMDEARAGYPNLRGRNLACWCPIGAPCHADVLLYIANASRTRRLRIDLEAIMRGYGYRIERGRAVRLEAKAP